MLGALLLATCMVAAPARLVIGTQGAHNHKVLVQKAQAKWVRSLPFALVVDVPDEARARALLKRMEGVRYVERETSIVVGLRAPNDPLWQNLWHLHPTSVSSPDAVMGLIDAWLVTEGAGARIAIVDDGFDLVHEDLAFADGQNFADGQPFDATVSPGTGDSHGTQTAGLIGARKDNGLGVVGVCPGCELVPIRLIGGGGPADLYEIDSTVAAAAIAWATDQGQADVINNSWGPPDGNPFAPDETKQLWRIPTALDEAIRYAITHGRGGKGSVVVFASGNGNELVSYDGFANHPSVLTVGAIDALAERAWYSDYGPGLKLVAPSSGKTAAPKLWSTDQSGAAGETPGNYVDNFGGTSGAAALVSGVLGLVLARYPDLSAAQAIEALLVSAVQVNAARARYNDTGFSKTYGYGRVDAPGALNAAALYTNGCTFDFELCGNNLDDDCNGVVDDPQRCATCVPDHGQEICDGHDNNCDGQVDEAFVCQTAHRPVCAPCQQTKECALGSRCRPHPDILGTHCFVDCGANNACPTGFACNGEVCLLQPTSAVLDCDAYLSWATPERCDGLGNDCNALVDDCDGAIDPSCANSEGCNCATGAGDPIMIGLWALAVLKLRARNKRAQPFC